MRLKEGTPLAAAALVAPLAATAWWMLVDDISVGQAFASPVPYVLGAIAWFVATPVYVALSGWIRGRFWSLLALALIGATPFALLAFNYFLPPRSYFAVFLILSTAAIAGASFWAVLRLFSRRAEA